MKRSVFFALFALISLATQAQTFDELIAKGDSFYAAKNYTEAIKFFTQAIALEPNLAKGYWYRGDANRELDQFQEAINDYSVAIDLDPKNAKFRKLRGDSYYSLKQFAQAEKDYTKGLEIDPKNATLWLYRGDCSAQLKAKDKACADYKIAQELGSRNAKAQAQKIGCDWVNHMVGGKPCPTGDAAISKVEMDPLSGAVFISKGLTFDKFEIKNEAGQFVTGPEVAVGQTFTVTLTNPKNFCSDTDGVIFMGAGYEIKETGGREIEKIHNIYKEGQSFPPAQTNTISMKIKIAPPMVAGKHYELMIHFFDTKGNGELIVEMPMKAAARTLSAANFSNVNTGLGAGVISAGVGGQIKGMELHHKSHGSAIQFNQLEANAHYTLTASEVKNLNKHSDFMFRFVDPKGVIVIEHSGKSKYHGEHVKLDFSTEGVKPGNYTLWLKIQETEAPQNVGILIPVTVK